MSYLGKISAIVSANTGNYVRGLNESAAATRRFSKTIQDDLRRASTQATRAVDGILTPLQRVERAIQNAGARGLKFRGFDGAIRTVEELSKRLASIEDQEEIALAVRLSGLDNITQLKSIISDLREEEVDLVVNVGGVVGLERLRADIKEVNGTPVNVQTGISARRLDELIAKFRQLSPERLRALGQGIQAAQFERASASFKRLISFSEGVAASFTKASQQFAQLSAGIQVGFGPAFKNITDELQQFSEQLRETGKSASAFDDVAARAERAEQAIARLVEVQKLAASGARGTELGFVAPDVQRALERSAAVRDRAAATQDPRLFAADVQRAAQFANLVADRQAGVESARRVGNPQEIEAAINRLNKAIETSERFVSALAAKIATAGISIVDGISSSLAQSVDVPVDQLLGSAERLRAGFVDRLTQIEIAWERAVSGGLARTTEELDQRFFQLAKTIEGLDIADRVDLEPLIQGYRDAVKAGEGYAVVLERLIAIENALGEAQRRRASAAAAGLDDAKDEIGEQRKRIADQFLARTGGPGEAGLALGIDRRALQGIANEIEFLQSKIAQVAAQFRGPLLAATERYRKAAVAVFLAGAAATEEMKKELEEARIAVVNLTAAALKITPAQFGRELKNAGDVARNGFGNIQLAVQQAAFAVDDFFSVTGDLSQRIRAAGNNISQLGFILGGTNGLIAGIAFSISAQLVAGLIKWANAGRTAEIQTQALNDALARQKSLVEELAQAFASLGDSLARSAFSRPGGEARAFRRELEEIAKKQKELRDQRAFFLDEGVQTARADVRVAENRLGQASTRDQAVAAQRQLAEAQRRLAEAENRARQRASIGPELAGPRVADIFERAAVRAAEAARNEAAVRGAPDGGQRAFQAALDEGRRRRDEVAAGVFGAGNVQEQVRVLRGVQAVSDNAVAADIEQLIDALEKGARVAADKFAIEILKAAGEAARDIGLAQERVARAIDAGVPAAITLQTTLDKLAEEIDAAQSEIAEAQRAFAESAQSPEDVAARDRRVQRARERLAASEQQRRQAFGEAAAADRRAAVDPQDLFGARRDRAAANLQGADLSQGIFARRLRELEVQRSQLLEELNIAGTDGQRQNIERQLEANNAQAAALEAATLRVNRFAEAIGRAEQEVQSDVQSARQRADQARRADIRFGTADTARDRQRAEADLRAQQEAAREAERVFRLERDKLERGVGPRALGAADDFRRLRDIDERIASGDTTREERERLEEERRRINARIDAQVEASPEVREARDAAARVAEQQALRQRGEELLLTPGERGARDLTESLAAVRAAFEARAREEGGPLDRRGLAEAEQRLIREEQARVAPLVAQFADEVQNAVLQGPSRAALGATDASTLQGQSELNRLLRGDDPARDVNLIELQKQTEELRKLNAKLEIPVAGA